MEPDAIRGLSLPLPVQERFHCLELHYLEPKNNKNFSLEIGHTLESKTSLFFCSFIYSLNFYQRIFLYKASYRSWECKDRYELDLAR